MDIHIKFKINLINDIQIDQEIIVPADPRQPFEAQVRTLMHTALSQYATVGVLQESKPNHYVLTSANQIVTIECELPTILIASELPKILE